MSQSRANFYCSFELTNSCNLDCQHCLRQKDETASFLDYPLFGKIIDQLHYFSRPHISLTGGEPTLHPDFAKICQKIKNAGYTFHFVSNGHNFAKTINKIEESLAALSNVAISLDGAEEKMHDQIRGAGSFRQALGAIAAAQLKKIPTTVQFAINKKNYRQLDALAGLCSRLGVKNIRLSQTQPTPEAVSADLLLAVYAWPEIEEEAMRLNNIYQIPIELTAGRSELRPLAICRTLALQTININHNGELTFCCQLSNLAGSDNREDIIADLNKVSLPKAHKLLVEKIALVVKEKIDLFAEQKEQPEDSYPCWYCLKHFNKLSWLSDYPDRGWSLNKKS